MAKRQREQDHDDGAATETAELNTVFVDTNLGTHLAVLVCSSDTASDFKKKVALEHKHCFPEMGEIQVHSVKVNRRSNYYHLPDTILIWSAFHRVKRNWFLSVDASNIPTCLAIRSSLEPGTSSGVKAGFTNIDEDYRGFISDENRNQSFPFGLIDCAAGENVVSDMIVKPKADKPVEKTTDSHRGIYSQEHSVGTESPLKKKRKVRHTKDVCHNSGLEGGDAMSRPNGKDVRPNMSDSIVKGRLVSEETYLPSMAKKGNSGSILDSQNLNSSDRSKEDNGCESAVDYGLGEDVHPLGVVSIMVPGSSAGMVDASGGGGDVPTPGEKRKKRKAKKTAAKVHDRTDMEQIGKGERIKLSTDKMEEGKGLSLEHDHEVLMPSNSKAPGHVGPDVALQEASLLQDAKESNALDSKIDYECGQDVPTVHSGGVCTNISNHSVTLMDAGGGAGGGTGDPDSDGKKRKKKKVHKIAKVQGTSDVEQIGVGEMKKPHTETIRSEEKCASLEHDNEVIQPADSKAPEADHVDPDLALEEASIIGDADAVMEPEISSCIKKRKKKKMEKKSVSTNIENSGIKEIHNGIRGSLDLTSPSGDHITEGTGKEESTRLNEEMDIGMRLLDASNHDAQEKVLDVNRKEADFVESQAEQTLEELSNRSKMMTEKTKNFPGVCHAAFPTAETENAIIESNQAGKDNANTDNKSRKAKRKKQKHTATDVQENGIRGSLDLPPSSGDHITKGAGKEEGTRLNEEMDVEMRLLDASNHDAQEKVLDVNRKEADLVESQAEQTLEELSVRNKMMTEKTKSFPGVCHAAFPTAETENAIIESNQVGKDNENTDNKSRKATKKRKKQKHTATDVQENGIKGSLDLPSPSGDHITKGTGKEESTRLNEGMDVEIRLLDASNHDAQEKVLDVNRKEADLVESQAEQTLEELSIRNNMMMEKTKSFPGVCHAAFPTEETENTIMESNQVGKDNENTDDKFRKATKKRKKQKTTATDVQENLPAKYQQVGNEPLATKETSIGFANSELEGRNVDSSQVLSRENEKKVGENYELVLNTDGLRENTERGGEGVNFKQYFVADQLQNQVDLSNKAKKATKLKRSSTKAKDNDLPPINISTELQNSLKSVENEKTDNNSYGEDTVKSVRNSAPKTDRDEMSPNYVKRSSEAAEKEVKDSSPPELCEMPRQKPNDTVAPSSFQNKNPSLVKSSSERPKALHNNRGKEKLLLGQNVTNMMLMKTPKKKILLAKSGAIFQDNSGESSGDENGTMQSDDSTLSPSDSSSMSGDSEGESEVSQNSTSNGTNDARGKSMAKLEEDLTMDMILRSSKRFNKAKEVASQSETQPIEFVPDSQPV